MKVSQLLSVKLKNYKLWLFAIALGLIAVNLSLTLKIIGNLDQISSSMLFWVALLSVIWKKRNTLNLESDLFSSLAGLSLIALILIKSISLFWFESAFIKFSALLSFLGLGLLASGLRGLKQYRQEFIILVLIVTSEGVLMLLIDKIINTSILSAKFSTFVLWYLGFDVYRQGASVILPTGAIDIYPACSGLNAMLLLLRVGMLFIVVFPLPLYKKILVPITAVFLAFIINVFRLALMALLVASSNHEAFHYWHGDNGSQIFSTISILAFGIFCHFIWRSKEPSLLNSTELTKE